MAAKDAKRHTEKAERHRMAAAEALYLANRSDHAETYENGVQAEAALDYRGEALLHASMAERSERRAKKALAKLIQTSPRSCALCGDTGRITGNGSAAIGGPPVGGVL